MHSDVEQRDAGEWLEHRRLVTLQGGAGKDDGGDARAEGLLPVCASCKKVRTSDGSWTQMEAYIESHSEASFSHGLCPECIPLYLDKDTDI